MNWVVSESKVGTPEASLLKSDVEIAMEHLKQENAKLHAMLAQLRAESAQPVAGSAPSSSAPSSLGAPSSLSEAVPGERSVIFVCTSSKAEDPNGAFVAVMDVNDDEWWEVIDPDKDRALQPEAIDEDYVMVEDKEVLSALSKFVAGTLKGYPESKALPPAQLKKLLDRSFSTLQEKGTLMKMYDWASFAYTSYGWATYGWALYQDPTLLKMVAKWSFSAATWVMFLL